MFAFTSAKALPVGAEAPEATALTDTGVSLKLSEVYAAHSYTLVFFYPRANTPGCTAQSCSLRDAFEVLTEKGVHVIGVSTDSVERQAKFKSDHNLPYTLLADTEKEVMKAFGQSGLRPMASRQAFLIHQGKVVYSDLRGATSRQADDILTFLAAAENT